MAPLRRFAAGLRALFRRRRDDHELDDELRAYLDAAVEEKVAAGLDRDSAMRAARAEMGSFEAAKEHVRDAGWESRLETLWHDVRYAVRSLRRTPAFTALAVVTLALAIGANTAIFSVVNSLMLRTLPVHEPDRLGVVSSVSWVKEGFTAGWPYAIWRQIDLNAHVRWRAIAWSAVGSPSRFNLATAGETDVVDGLFVSGEFFRTLGVNPILGRTFTAADDVPGGGPHGPVAVISYDMWQTRFGGAGDVIGRRLVVEQVPFTVAGVTPPGFFGVEVGRSFDVAVPIGAQPLMYPGGSWLEADGPGFLGVMLRLAPEQSTDEATATLRGLQHTIVDAAVPNTPDNVRYRQDLLNDPLTVVPAASGTSELRTLYRRPLLTMLAIVALVLLIACTNIANLLLARAAARRHELSVRLSLGAPRWRLASELLVECLILAGAGAAAGLLCAGWAARAIVGHLATFGAPATLSAALDWRVLAFTGTATIVTALLFGTLPSVTAAGADPNDALKDRGAHASSGRTVSRSWNGVIVAQVVLSLVLLVGAGLFIRTFQQLASRPPGFDSDRVLVARVDASRVAVDPPGRMHFFQQLVDAVSAVRGVAKAAASTFTPVGFGLVMVGGVEDSGTPATEPRPPLPTYFVTPGWFAAYGSAVTAGRDFDEHDTSTAVPVVVVNEAYVRRFFPDGHAVGRVVRMRGPADTTAKQMTVVGVVGDVILSSLWDVVPPTLYFPLTQWPAWPNGEGPPMPSELPAEISLTIRSASGSPGSLIASVAAALTAVDDDLSFSFRPLDDAVDATIAWERLVAALSALFGGLALTLSAIGLYGVTSYGAAQRRKEVGIRLALGAQRADVIGLVVRRTLVVTALGIVVGLGVSAGVTRYLEGMLFGITPLDATTFASVALLFCAVAGLAAFVPARRAATADPLVALRSE